MRSVGQLMTDCKVRSVGGQLMMDGKASCWAVDDRWKSPVCACTPSHGHALDGGMPAMETHPACIIPEVGM